MAVAEEEPLRHQQELATTSGASSSSAVPEVIYAVDEEAVADALASQSVEAGNSRQEERRRSRSRRRRRDSRSTEAHARYTLEPSHQQIIRALVRFNEQRILLDRAGALLKCLTNGRRNLVLVIMFLFFWNCMELQTFHRRFKERDGGDGHFKCDHTILGRRYVLDTWYNVMIFVTPIGRILHADCVLRRICNYSPEFSEFGYLNTAEEGNMILFPETVRPGMPMRIQILSGLFLLFHVSWSLCGLYWSCQDDVCRGLNPRLEVAVGTMSVSMIIYVVLSQLSHLQVARLVQLLSQEDAQRAREVEAQAMAGCQEVELDAAGGLANAADLEEPIPSECPICMDALFGAPAQTAGEDDQGQLCSKVIKAPCGHVFHTPCLRRWASRAPTCPLCRQDLRGLDSTSTQQAIPELRLLLAQWEHTNPAEAEAARRFLYGNGAADTSINPNDPPSAEDLEGPQTPDSIELDHRRASW